MSVSVPISRLFALMAAFALCLFAATPQAPAAEREAGFEHLDAHLQSLASDQLEELMVFVAGNALFTIYHEAGHMLVSELELPVLAQEEDAVDNLATVVMLAADTDEWDLLLINAMIGWFLIADADNDPLVFHTEHALDRQRGYRILCLMVGADEDTFRDLARELDLPEDRIETCAFDYEQAADSWEAATDRFLRASADAGGRISVVHEPAPAGLDAMALLLKTSGLLEQVSEEFDTAYALPENITFRASTCGEENAFWDPETREVILCHELLGGFARLYLDNLLPTE